MNNLYIIGNGFDLHHEIPSGYKDYREWLELNNPDVLNTIDNLFGYCNSNWWKHFEESLASVETLRIAVEKTAENSTIERDSDWYVAENEVERMIDEAFEDIKSSFYEWINSLPHGKRTPSAKRSTVCPVPRKRRISHTRQASCCLCSAKIMPLVTNEFVKRVLTCHA